MRPLGMVYFPIVHRAHIRDLGPDRRERTRECAERLAKYEKRDECGHSMCVELFFLHERGELGAILLHYFHRSLHLALAAFLAPLALGLRHASQLPLRVLFQEKALEGHVKLRKVRTQLEAADGSRGEVERKKRKECKRFDV